MPRDVKAVYVTTVDVPEREGEPTERTLDVWMNPETQELVGVENMRIDSTRNSIPDPYRDDVRLVFEDTFSGLPK